MTASVSPAPPLGEPEPPKPKSGADAARQFEGLLLGQMLRTIHANGSSLGEEDSSSETMWDVATQQFAQLLADRGGLGLANIIARGLER